MLYFALLLSASYWKLPVLSKVDDFVLSRK